MHTPRNDTPADAPRTTPPRTPKAADALALLRALGAEDVAHPGGTLLAHLRRVHDRLAAWGARDALRLAGLCHAAYGTDGFATALLPPARRGELAAVIGAEAEALVHRYASCDRAATHPALAEPTGPFRDRLTGATSVLSARERADLAELTAANELDLAAEDPAFRAAHGDDLLALFTRLEPLLSPAARQDVPRVLAPAPPDRPWTVAVLGPGGVGGLLAGLLARAGHRVVCVAGERTVQALRAGGLRVSSRQFGDFAVPVEADTALREPVDLCLVTVKHTALADALARVPDAAPATGTVVPLLNGVEHPAALRAHFASGRVVPGVIRVESARTAPGVITHHSPFTEIDLAGPPERLAPLADVLRAAGVRTRVRADETAMLWAKLAFLAPLALLTTRHRRTAGEVRDRHRAELVALVEEAAAVARACGAATDPAQVLALYDSFPPDTRSSMQRDAEAGRPLELDAIGGALLRAAARHRVATPVARRLVADLTPPMTA
ncbi:hypothetical protein GCM10018785_67330 [Streptomyces longispororuber]|uniref:2-dehydropantoate 2-reductase n=1 Tax=Streptomyces longispororuber TaxID=68230 RepID=A0A919A7Z7_9ACTN|nr:hypothetical protein GCM10018785_67330 [Streptomyces longispororuber]